MSLLHEIHSKVSDLDKFQQLLDEAAEMITTNEACNAKMNKGKKKKPSIGIVERVVMDPRDQAAKEMGINPTTAKIANLVAKMEQVIGSVKTVDQFNNAAEWVDRAWDSLEKMIRSERGNDDQVEQRVQDTLEMLQQEMHAKAEELGLADHLTFEAYSKKNTFRLDESAKEDVKDAPFDGAKPKKKSYKDRYGNEVKHIAKHLAKKGMAEVKK